MAGCDGCLTSKKGQDEQLITTRAKALQYVEEKKQAVAIYREGYEFRYCLADVAIEQGYLVTEILSQHQSASAEPVH